MTEPEEVQVGEPGYPRWRMAYFDIHSECHLRRRMGGDEDITGYWGLVADDTDFESDVVVRNTPYVRFSILPQLSLLLFFPLQDEESDSWDAIANYVFQVISFPTRGLFLGRSNSAAEEFRC